MSIRHSKYPPTPGINQVDPQLQSEAQAPLPAQQYPIPMSIGSVSGAAPVAASPYANNYGAGQYPNQYGAAPQAYGHNPGVAFPYGNSNNNNFSINTKSNAFGFLTDEDGALAKVHKYMDKFDEFLGKYGAPIKPYLPFIGRFLIVATFLEDGVRIVSQWDSQVSYIWSYRGLPRFLTVLYLGLNVIFMWAGSILVLTHKHLLYGVGVLLFVVISQALVYGLVFNASFFFRNMSIIGGLLVVMSDAFARDRRSLSLAGLPLMDEKDRSKYFMLAGRVLMIFLFFAYVATEHFSVLGLIVVIIGFISCALVVIGYKTRLSAAVLVLILTYRNMTTNQYWQFDSNNPARDFLRYEHFQILSIVGGLLLVVNTGAGALSIDEKKKIY